jgi:hypothetical protein
MMFIYVLYGDRDLTLFNLSVNSVLRFYPNAKISVYSDFIINDTRFDNIVYTKTWLPADLNLDHTRTGNRVSSFMRIKALLMSDHLLNCYLDNDIIVVNKNFASGFRIAARYGLAVPQNPRIFVRTNENGGDLDIGADTTDDQKKDNELSYYTAINLGVMFVNKSYITAMHFLRNYYEKIEENPNCRGQTNFYNTLNKSNYYPYILPQQYLACRDIEQPLAIHGSRKELLTKYVQP